MPSVRLQNTGNDCTPNPKRTNQTSRSLPTSKSSCVTITVMPKAYHSRNSSSFSDSKHFFCSTCHKCVFTANHDACIKKLLNEVNSRKVKPHKTKNSNNPVEQKSHTQKPGRQIFLGHRWIPTGKIFTDNTTKVDSDPLNGSNDDITNPYECDQTLNVSSGTLNLSAVQASLFNDKWCLQTTLQAPFLKEKKVFGALCYPTNDSEDLGKLQPTADIGIFVGYAPSRKGYRIYNKRTRRIMETIHVQFDELTEQMAPVQLSTGPAPTFLTPGQISSGLVPNSVPAAPYVPPTNKELEILFQPMFDEYMEPPRVERPVSPAPAVQVPVNSAGTPSSTTIDQDAPSPNNPFAPVDNHPFINVFAPEPSFEASLFGDLSSAESPYVSQTLHHLEKWSKDHPLDNIIGNPSRPVSTRKQLATDALWCLYNSLLSKVEPKNFKSAITEDC
ncbi:putative ribonuclease H-like domain-containing protein [Tanacetum coccineum]